VATSVLSKTWREVKDLCSMYTSTCSQFTSPHSTQSPQLHRGNNIYDIVSSAGIRGADELLAENDYTSLSGTSTGYVPSQRTILRLRCESEWKFWLRDKSANNIRILGAAVEANTNMWKKRLDVDVSSPGADDKLLRTSWTRSLSNLTSNPLR
jgi:hypothetical protein